MRLIWRFIVTKPDITVRPEDLRFAELGSQLFNELLHRPQYLRLVDRLAAGPVLLRVVRLEALVKHQRLRWPPAERHGPSLRWRPGAKSKSRLSPNGRVLLAPRHPHTAGAAGRDLVRA